MIDKILMDAIQWAWNSPAVRGVLVREAAELVSREVMPEVDSWMDDFRRIARKKESAKREAEMNKMIVEMRKADDIFLEELIRALEKEPDSECRRKLADAARDRLRIYKSKHRR